MTIDQLGQVERNRLYSNDPVPKYVFQVSDSRMADPIRQQLYLGKYLKNSRDEATRMVQKQKVPEQVQTIKIPSEAEK